ncbi:protein-disulfide reductase DsbD domain-containing protein [uncultured Roseovarius sp.]|uniref:protein-disulfide reductase DsbD domain-containing protein n=1 Tax=uncultured Roseovarius sp. TaxID=293344 RepID=UPI002601752E|nr:protein-disulfide reductase DsbD domain-containing protein [uncultured Roseovarius sp.]
MIRQCLLTVAAVVSLGALPVFAQSANDMVRVSILPGWRMADGSHMAAIKFVLTDGWKTYWRAPGEAGIPPRFDWSASANLERVEIEWPTPQQTMTNGMRTIGYANDLVLPVRLTPEREGRPITLGADMEIGVCSDICVPVSLSVTQQLGVEHQKPDPQIAGALAARPYSQEEAGVGRVACDVSPVEGGLRLVAEVDVPAMGTNEFVVVETNDPSLWVAQAKSRRDGRRLHAETEIFHVEGHGFILKRDDVRLTILSSGDAVDIQGCPAR